MKHGQLRWPRKYIRLIKYFKQTYSLNQAILSASVHRHLPDTSRKQQVAAALETDASLEERLELALRQRAPVLGLEVQARLIELAVDNNRRGLDARSADNGLVGGETEEPVVAVLLSDCREDGCGCVGRRAQVGDDDDLVRDLDLLVVLGRRRLRHSQQRRA